MKTRLRSRRPLFFIPAILVGLLLSLALEGCGPPSPNRPASSARYVVGLSPFLDDAVKDQVFRHLVGFLLQDMALGSSLRIYDAYYLRTVTQIDIPNVRAFQSAKTRANQFKDQIHAVKAFLAARPARPQVGRVPFDQAVRFPQFLEFLSRNHLGSHGTLEVLVLGSPLYLDEKEAGFSMVDGYFPSDGHLLASRDQSVYGRDDSEQKLGGARVHFGYFGDPWISDAHRERVERFWTLFVERQGGRLATFCGDLDTVFNALRAEPDPANTAVPRPGYVIDPRQTKLEMLRVSRQVGVADWITRELPGTRPPPPSTTVGPMKIGIRWQGDLDLDLYARPRHEGEMLFFDHTRIPEGYYYKDHRTSPDREYEFIEFERPVDVEQVEAFTNFYKGSAPGGTGGEVRIEFEGRIYARRFAIRADHGNRGRSGEGQDAFWTRIDIPALLGLRSRSLAGPNP